MCSKDAAGLACHNHAVSVIEIAGYRFIRQLGAGGMVLGGIDDTQGAS